MRSALILVLLVACGGKSEPPPQTPISNQAPPTAKPAVEPDPVHKRPDCDAIDNSECAMQIVEYFAKEMCNCKDKACADTVNEGYSNWGMEMAKRVRGTSSSKPDAELTKKMVDAAMLYNECFAKLAMAADPSTGSAAP